MDAAADFFTTLLKARRTRAEGPFEFGTALAVACEDGSSPHKSLKMKSGCKSGWKLLSTAGRDEIAALLNRL
ncbi:hypothetical protein SK3146_04341 [Paenibacillus konkukensis]|uniref:Uncharacterized protein n=1 Tax=Paenibacillus konkukensis TaxID=2020716 RepID=A0ABY4RSF7_9BACL|nr:hypothetical protein SK3146_04341 [Paenibacillus konkukensis]